MHKTTMIGIGLVWISLSGVASAQETETPTQRAAETAPQSGASTTVKAPAGVTTTNKAEQNAGSDAKAGVACKSASAEMTNGNTETCKQ